MTSSSSTKISIVLVNSPPIFIKGFTSVIGEIIDMELVQTFDNFQSFVDYHESALGNVALVYVEYEGQMIEFLSLLKGKNLTIKILLISSLENSYPLKRLLKFGIDGVILRSCKVDELLQSIRLVNGGDIYIQNEIKELFIHQSFHKNANPTSSLLTKREKEILELIASNKSSKEIAELLYLSKRTVENHRASLLMKLNVKNSAALIKRAMELNMLKGYH